MSTPSPNGNIIRPPRDDEDDDEMPTIIPQSVMTAVSVVMVLALILGSATAVVALTDWGLTVAMLVGLVAALLLLVAWIRMPKRRVRR